MQEMGTMPGCGPRSLSRGKCSQEGSLRIARQPQLLRCTFFQDYAITPSAPDVPHGHQSTLQLSTIERRRRVHIDGEEVLALDDALAGRRLAERLCQMQRARAACCRLPHPCATQNYCSAIHVMTAWCEHQLHFITVLCECECVRGHVE